MVIWENIVQGERVRVRQDSATSLKAERHEPTKDQWLTTSGEEAAFILGHALMGLIGHKPEDEIPAAGPAYGGPPIRG